MKKLFSVILITFFLLNIEVAFAQSTIPSASFERWDNFFLEQPNGWITSAMADPSAEKKSASKTTDAYHGKYALKLETVETEIEGQKTIMQGFAVTAKFDFVSFSMGFPCESRPDKLLFHYKYAPAFQDSMVVTVFLRKSDPVYGTVMVGAGTFVSSERKDTYTAGELHIEYMSEDIPDTAMIMILSGVDTANAGSILLIDNLRFDYKMSNKGVAKLKGNSLQLGNIYPQPARDKINFPLNSPQNQPLEIEITDMFGKRIWQSKEQLSVGANNIPVELNNYKPGIYLYKLSAGGQSQTGKFVVSE